MKTLFSFLLLFTFLSLAAQNRYMIETDLGNIELETYPDKAPITATNFDGYITRGDFTGASFYRVVRMDNQPNDSIRIEVIQGNVVEWDRSAGNIEHETTKQTGLLHKDGAISMARGKPGTASCSFFICINDNPDLDYGGMRNPDGQGFSAFGYVTKGMDIVRKIQMGEIKGQSLVTPINIKKITKL